MMRFSCRVITLTALLAIAGCDKGPPKVEAQVRAIKAFTVTEVASGQTRKFSGIVHATDSSAVSFQVGGNVQTVRADLGDRVRKGQILAVLDKKPYELNVMGATAELGKAKAAYAHQQTEYVRQKKLYDQKWIAKVRLDQVERTRESARNAVEFATSTLGLAKRDLRHTVLKAPFDGVIAKKMIDPFVEVKAGQKLFEIEASGAIEVRIDVPETEISRITLGMPFTARVAGIEGCGCTGRITEIGSTAGRANAFPIKAGFNDPPSQLRSGMTAEVTFLLKQEGTESAYLVPLAAVAAADQPGQGHVFIYDATTQTVKKNLIKGKGSSDNLIHVYEGVKAGDIVAAAGVSFLHDGQKVKLMVRQTSNVLGGPATAQ